MVCLYGVSIEPGNYTRTRGFSALRHITLLQRRAPEKLSSIRQTSTNTRTMSNTQSNIKGLQTVLAVNFGTNQPILFVMCLQRKSGINIDYRSLVSLDQQFGDSWATASHFSHCRSIFGEIALGKIKFPAIHKTDSIFTLLLFSLLLQNCTPDIYKKSLRIRI